MSLSGEGRKLIEQVFCESQLSLKERVDSKRASFFPQLLQIKVKFQECLHLFSTIVYPFEHIHTDNFKVGILEQYLCLNIDETIKLEIEQNKSFLFMIHTFIKF